jgi:hypothetical protein
LASTALGVSPPKDVTQSRCRVDVAADKAPSHRVYVGFRVSTDTTLVPYGLGTPAVALRCHLWPSRCSKRVLAVANGFTTTFLSCPSLAFRVQRKSACLRSTT